MHLCCHHKYILKIIPSLQKTLLKNSPLIHYKIWSEISCLSNIFWLKLTIRFSGWRLCPVGWRPWVCDSLIVNNKGTQVYAKSWLKHDVCLLIIINWKKKKTHQNWTKNKNMCSPNTFFCMQNFGIQDPLRPLGTFRNKIQNNILWPINSPSRWSICKTCIKIGWKIKKNKNVKISPFMR